MSQNGGRIHKKNLILENDRLKKSLSIVKSEYNVASYYRHRAAQWGATVTTLLFLSIIIGFLQYHHQGIMWEHVDRAESKFRALDRMFVPPSDARFSFDGPRIVTSYQRVLGGGPVECTRMDDADFSKGLRCSNDVAEGTHVRVYNISAPTNEQVFIRCFMRDDGRVLPDSCLIHMHHARTKESTLAVIEGEMDMMVDNFMHELLLTVTLVPVEILHSVFSVLRSTWGALLVVLAFLVGYHVNQRWDQRRAEIFVGQMAVFAIFQIILLINIVVSPLRLFCVWWEARAETLAGNANRSTARAFDVHSQSVVDADLAALRLAPGLLDEHDGWVRLMRNCDGTLAAQPVEADQVPESPDGTYYTRGTLQSMVTKEWVTAFNPETNEVFQIARSEFIDGLPVLFRNPLGAHVRLTAWRTHGVLYSFMQETDEFPTVNDGTYYTKSQAMLMLVERNKSK